MQRQGKKQAVEGIMGSTTDGGGGSKSGSELRQRDNKPRWLY